MLPQFSSISVSGTYAMNNQTFSGAINFTNVIGSGYRASVAGLGDAYQFGAAFNTVAINGKTFTLSGLVNSSDSYIQQSGGGNYPITSASVTLTFTPGGDPTAGNATATITFTSLIVTLSGTFSGSYKANY
jgi:hypothetical protein